MTTHRFRIRRSPKTPALRLGFALVCAAAALGSGCAPVGQIAPVVATASPSGGVIDRVARTAGLAVGLVGTPSETGPVPTAEIKVTYEMKLYGDINEEILPAFDPRAVCIPPHKEAAAK
jgi:hypothetical protein